MLKRNSLRDILLFTIFHVRYIVYLSFINSSSKNSLVEIEFYRKKIIKQHFFLKKKVSRKTIRKEMHIFEIGDL